MNSSVVYFCKWHKIVLNNCDITYIFIRKERLCCLEHLIAEHGQHCRTRAKKSCPDILSRSTSSPVLNNTLIGLITESTFGAQHFAQNITLSKSIKHIFMMFHTYIGFEGPDKRSCRLWSIPCVGRCSRDYTS